MGVNKSLLKQKDDKIAFFTHYQQKYDEISKLMGADSIEQVWFPDLPTYEGYDLADLALARVELLYQRLQRPCFIEEASLEVEGCFGFPGRCFREIVNNDYFRFWTKENNGKKAKIRLCVGYVGRDGESKVFEATQHGTIVMPQTEQGWNPDPRAIGWDIIFSPNHITNGKTIADLIEHKHFIDVRLQLYLTFRELINPSAESCYEIHITVALPENLRHYSTNEGTIGELIDFANNFRQACKENGLRPLTILEDTTKDNKQIQFQTAVYRCFKSNQEAIQHAYETSKLLSQKYGFEICRTRVEAMAHSKFAPKTNENLGKEHANCYFEFHRRASLWKTSFEKIKEIVSKHETLIMHPHVSKVGPKVFINARFFDMGYKLADYLWNEMENDLSIESDLQWTKKRLDEYAIHDDDIDMDTDYYSKTNCKMNLFNLFTDWLNQQ